MTGICQIVDWDYASVSVLEDMRQISLWLQQREYFAVVNEDLETVGIVTAKDCLHHPADHILDFNISKPGVDINENIGQVFRQMQEAESAYLPVLQQGKFAGVISLWSITRKLLEMMEEKSVLNA